MKGVILTAGAGSRMRPLTDFVCKPLLPVYDKPMLYYPLTTLINAGIKDVMIVVTPQDAPAIQRTIGDGSRWGMNIQYAVQQEPKGPLEAVLLAEPFIAGDSCTLIFGDNIFVSDSLSANMTSTLHTGATIFGMAVSDPERFGVIEFEAGSDRVTGLEEKPQQPKSNMASVGLYTYDHELFDRMSHIQVSPRGEREIVDLNSSYMRDGLLSYKALAAEDHWLDAGLFESMYEASGLVRALQQKGRVIGSPELAAFKQGWIDQKQMAWFVDRYRKNTYGQMLEALQGV